MFNAGQYEKAKEMFKELTRDISNPRIAEVYYYLAKLTTYPDSTIIFYKKIIDNHPNSRYADIAYLETAKTFIGIEDFKNALHYLNELNKNFPDTELKDEILFWTGIAYIETGNKNGGYQALQELIKKYPRSIWANRAKNLLPSELPQPQKEYYTVQVGSFRNKENAVKRVEELKQKGFEARIVEAVVMDKTHYRVWVGEFETMEKAKSLVAKLDSLGIKGNVVKGY
ncbi:MAG: SPOR domain-containing protein [candidate division WOR-3 bacterium]|nr:SPOR domain-containing protein [candidate division WOR-3 bacterium]